ncbi:MAG: glycosyltransferase family 2 protein [Myxococcales bacterium]|nr:glycosyltransferase family 2 protein [Myxococcales bacterium]
MAYVIWIIDWVFLLFFVGLNGSYLTMIVLSMYDVIRRGRRQVYVDVTDSLSDRYMPPVTIIAPAYNEELTIDTSLRSLLSLRYGEFEVVVVNDGSKDNTVDVLIRDWQLYPIAVSYDQKVHTQHVRGVYRSRRDPRLTVVDKENGGKADALNCGINMAQYGLVCGIDADTLILPDALSLVALPFAEDPERVVATGGTIRVANGCKIVGGEVRSISLPSNYVAAFQFVEYLRAFLIGRAGMNVMGGTLIISGAFGLFDRDTVVDVGGYRHDTVGEDMELVVRMHRILRERERPYRIEFVWDAACYTEVPEDLGVLKRQRNRWHRGLIDSLMRHRVMMFNPRYGVVGLVIFPFFAIFELFGPVIELAGFIIVILSAIVGYVDVAFMSLFLLVAFILGINVSLGAVLLEEMTYAALPTWRGLGRTVWLAVLENLGYRQLSVMWRVRAFWDYYRGNQQWGAMVRKGFSGGEEGGGEEGGGEED